MSAVIRVFFLLIQSNMYTQLLESDQISHTFIPLCESRLKHSAAEFQSIQQLDIVS